MNVWFDLQYAWRLFIKSWGYSLMCASVVALSVGLAVWTCALGYSQLWKPLEFPGSEQWYSVQLSADATARARPSIDAYTYQELLAHHRAADHLGAFADLAVVLSEGQATTSLRAAAISPRLFAATHVAPRLGRIFDSRDGQPGASAVAILSFDAWQQYFAGDPAIIGRTVRIDAAPVRVIGVMPRDFLAFEDFEVWMPLHLPQLARPADSTMTLTPLILLREHQTLGPIANEMKAAVDAVNRDHPQLFDPARHVTLIPAFRMFTHNAAPIVTMLSLMAAAVLLLGCVNISMVFFARLLERSRELALRTALGASRGRLLRQCLIETALVVLLGLLAGYALAALGIQWTHGIGAFISRVMASGRQAYLPTLRSVDLLWAVLSAMAIWILSTLIPAWHFARQDPAVILAGSGKGATVRDGNRSVRLLVGLQVVISCLVLVTCGNVVVAVEREVNKPHGLNTAQVLISIESTVFDARLADASRRLRYWENLTASIESHVPGSRVAFTTSPPTRPGKVAASIETREGAIHDGRLTLPRTVVSDNYFALLGIRLRSGRLFDSTDDSASLPVVIIDESMASRFWPGENALGKRVRLNGSGQSSWLTVVGVVSAVPGGPYRTDASLGTMYQPLRQVVPPDFQVLIRLPDKTTDHRVALRAAAFAVDRDLPLHNLQTLDDYLAAVNLSYTAMVPILIVIALITALLAGSGLFGLISRSVAQRTQEVGIRRALGATSWRATSMFLRQGSLYLSVAVVGLALGILMMPLLSRAITNILDQVFPVTLGVVLLMAALIFTASYLPTRRALALDPGDALRSE